MDTYFVRDLLLREIETEIGKTRPLLEALPDGVHHRAQLGTYIRALGLPLPGMYGPSADGI